MFRYFHCTLAPNDELPVTEAKIRAITSDFFAIQTSSLQKIAEKANLSKFGAANL
jgi:hypothetical protein